MMKVIKECDFVNYNVKSERRVEELNELDVIGLDFKNKSTYLCKVTTHINVFYIKIKTTVKK